MQQGANRGRPVLSLRYLTRKTFTFPRSSAAWVRALTSFYLQNHMPGSKLNRDPCISLLERMGGVPAHVISHSHLHKHPDGSKHRPKQTRDRFASSPMSFSPRNASGRCATKTFDFQPSYLDHFSFPLHSSAVPRMAPKSPIRFSLAATAGHPAVAS
jgi:hypothetical protein